MNEADLAKNQPPVDDTQSSGGANADTVANEDDELEAAIQEAAQARGDGGNDTLRDAEERALRAQAELENFRKRARRDMEEERKYAKVPLLHDLLSVVDNLERALEAAGQQENSGGLLEGVKMVAQQLSNVLEQHDCQRIADIGTPFDPNLHEAIGQEFSDEHEEGVITRVTRTGYRIHDRVVRPSQVMISKGLPNAD